MGEAKQNNIKNRTYYFYNDIIDLKKFDARLLTINKKSYENIGIYYTGYIAIKKIDTIKKIDDYESIYSTNLLYLCINNASGYIEEKNGNRYLIFDSVGENKEVLNKYAGLWDGIKNKIKAINGDKENDYGKNYMNDVLPLNKLLKFCLMTIIIRCVFSEDGKPYPQLFIDNILYEL